MAQEYKSGYVAIIGEPNVGKSTLLNALLQQKISIVTPKPQTTRQRILGILSEEGYQIIFLDTPGLVKPHYQLHSFMLEEIRSSIQDADIVLLMVDAGHPYPAEIKEWEKNLQDHPNLVLALNKIDLVKKDELLPVIDHWKEQLAFREIVPIAALTGDGVDILREVLAKHLQPGPPFYPPEMVSEQPERFFVAELVRETLFSTMKQEIPYSCAVMVDPFKTRGKKVYIRATIFVERNTQKGILIGKNGANLKNVGAEARKKVEEFLEQEVFLDLWVKVNKDWKKDLKSLEKLGYRH